MDKQRRHLDVVPCGGMFEHKSLAKMTASQLSALKTHWESLDYLRSHPFYDMVASEYHMRNVIEKSSAPKRKKKHRKK